MSKILFIKRMAVGLVFGTLICISFVYAQNQSSSTEEDAYALETVSGEVSGITDRYISVICDRDYDTGTEEETLIPIDQNTSIKHKKSIDEIKRGDLISVEYENPTENSKRKPRARTINFIQSGLDNLVSEVVDNAAQPQE